MDHNRNVIKFPRRGRYATRPAPPMTPERLARGREWLDHLRELIGEGRS